MQSKFNKIKGLEKLMPVALQHEASITDITSAASKRDNLNVAKLGEACSNLLIHIVEDDYWTDTIYGVLARRLYQEACDGIIESVKMDTYLSDLLILVDDLPRVISSPLILADLSLIEILSGKAVK